MTRNGSLVRCLAIALLAAGIAVWAGSPAVALAQCGEPPKSSCTTCHETEDPIATQGQWHYVHAAKDFCTSCHGGNGSTLDKTLAHDGIVANPLTDIYTDCHACHPYDYEARAERFAVALNVTPGSCATPTAAPASAAAGPVVTNPSAPTPGASLSWAAALGAAAAAGLFLLGLVALARHQPASP